MPKLDRKNPVATVFRGVDALEELIDGLAAGVLDVNEALERVLDNRKGYDRFDEAAVREAAELAKRELAAQYVALVFSED